MEWGLFHKSENFQSVHLWLVPFTEHGLAYSIYALYISPTSLNLKFLKYGRACILYSLNTIEIIHVDLIGLAKQLTFQVASFKMCDVPLPLWLETENPNLTSKSSNCEKPGKFYRNKLFIRIRGKRRLWSPVKSDWRYF